VLTGLGEGPLEGVTRGCRIAAGPLIVVIVSLRSFVVFWRVWGATALSSGTRR
jgi:hypothetical protein